MNFFLKHSVQYSAIKSILGCDTEVLPAYGELEPIEDTSGLGLDKMKCNASADDEQDIQLTDAECCCSC